MSDLTFETILQNHGIPKEWCYQQLQEKIRPLRIHIILEGHGTYEETTQVIDYINEVAGTSYIVKRQNWVIANRSE